ncbi:hypothetical protein Tco_1480603, partial [Tanacetum coccineum]
NSNSYLRDILGDILGKDMYYPLTFVKPIRVSLVYKRNPNAQCYVQRFIKKTGRNLDFKGKQPVTFDKRNATTNEPSSQALVAQDGLGGYGWSNDFDEPVNYALMAISSSSSLSSSDNEGYELALESLESRILGHEKNEPAWGEKYEIQNYELKYREIKTDNLKIELENVVKERDD